MACCVCFFQGSKTWIALFVPVIALFARLSSSFHGILLPLSVLLFSTLCLSTLFFKPKKQTLIESSQLLVLQNPAKPAAETELLQLLPPQEKASSEGQPGKFVPLPPVDQLVADEEKSAKENSSNKLVARSFQDLYSESDQCSSTSSEDHSSDTEWPYNNNNVRRHEGGLLLMDCSDDSISDEESLFEIAILSLSSSLKDHHPKNCCLQQQDQSAVKDFLADINDDNLIEIDINMGSIKYCSSFDTY